MNVAGPGGELRHDDMYISFVFFVYVLYILRAIIKILHFLSLLKYIIKYGLQIRFRTFPKLNSKYFACARNLQTVL